MYKAPFLDAVKFFLLELALNILWIFHEKRLLILHFKLRVQLRFIRNA